MLIICKMHCFSLVFLLSSAKRDEQNIYLARKIDMGFSAKFRLIMTAQHEIRSNLGSFEMLDPHSM